MNAIEERRHEELLRAYHEEGDRAARDRLVEEMLPLVRSLASRYAGRGEQVEDLVQVGAIGLIKAIDRFDLERGVELTTYAVPTIVGEIGATSGTRHGRCTSRAASRSSTSRSLGCSTT